MTPHLAVLDDEARMAEVLAMVLRKDGHRVSTFHHPQAFLQALAAEPFDLLLTDLRMPDMDGVQVLTAARAAQPDLPVVLITAHATIKTAIAAMRQGAFDVLEKPFDNDAARALVQRALDHTRLSRENRYLREQLQSRYRIDQLVVCSAALRAVFDLAARAARSRATVLITGESGTGKELVARFIHVYSERVGGPFVATNCKALAASVLESELFGHEKGAFTGAAHPRPGLFEAAHGGTLFLDEIGEIDLDFQAKLLRVLQEREVTRVGAHTPRTVDVRILAATNRNLREAVEEDRFREDLYFRLHVIPIHIPPLRERPDDILPLARTILARFADELGRPHLRWTPEAEHALLHHPWPGNVRELTHAVERAAVLAPDDAITPDDLLLDADAHASTPHAQALSLHELLDHAAREHIRAALAAAHGRRHEAAARLGVDRTTLYRLMKKLGVDDLG